MFDCLWQCCVLCAITKSEDVVLMYRLSSLRARDRDNKTHLSGISAWRDLLSASLCCSVYIGLFLGRRYLADLLDSTFYVSAFSRLSLDLPIFRDIFQLPPTHPTLTTTFFDCANFSRYLFLGERSAEKQGFPDLFVLLFYIYFVLYTYILLIISL